MPSAAPLVIRQRVVICDYNALLLSVMGVPLNVVDELFAAATA
jgi:hypothetical protein